MFLTAVRDQQVLAFSSFSRRLYRTEVQLFAECWFWMSFSVFMLCSSSPQTINGMRDRACQFNPKERPGRSIFPGSFWWQLWPVGAPDDAI